MLRIHLDDATRAELRSVRRESLPPEVRDRIEMPSLADAGWSAPRIAANLGHRGQTVRDRLKDSLARGPTPSARTDPTPDTARRGLVAGESRRSLAE